MSIPIIPNFPSQIKSAFELNKLAVFIGAGASRLIGCTGWADLARNYVKECFRKHYINYLEKERLLQEKDHKKTITICFHLLNQKNELSIFYSLMKNSFEINPELAKKYNIYHELASLNLLVITTNADTHLDKYFLKNIDGKFDDDDIDHSFLYHIHGSITNHESLIFTTRAYLRHYTNPNFQNFMKKIFQRYTVLFIGYGLGEFEILDYLIKTISPKNEEKKHFLLKPYFEHEKKFYELDNKYYNELGIEVCPFLKDEKGFNQLFYVIQNWKAKIYTETNFQVNLFSKIDKIFIDFNFNQADLLLKSIYTNNPAKAHFFFKLGGNNSPEKWIELLKKHNYFDFTRDIKYFIVQRQNYTYFCLNSFLYRIANINNENPSLNLSNFLKNIIKKIMKNYENLSVYINIRFIIDLIAFLPSKKYIFMYQIDFLTKFFKKNHINEHSGVEYSIIKLLKRIMDFNTPLIFEKLLKLCLGFTVDKNKTYYRINSFLKYSFRNLIPEISEKIVDTYPKETFQLIEQILRKLNSIEKNFGCNWNLLNEKSKKLYSDQDHYISNLLGLLRSIIIKSDWFKTQTFFEEYIDSDIIIFQKIAIFILNQNFGKYCSYFFSIEENLLSSYFLREELYFIFINHGKEMSKDNINKFISWIEDDNYIEKLYTDIEELELAKRKKGVRLKWLSSIQHLDHELVRKKILSYHDGKLIETSSNPFASGITSQSKVGNRIVSPIYNEEIEIFSKDNSDISIFLTKNPRKTLGLFEQNGSEISFSDLVKKNPKKYLDNLFPFVNVPQNWVHSLIEGLSYADISEFNNNWSSFIRYFEEIIEKSGFFLNFNEYDKNEYSSSIIIHFGRILRDYLNQEDQTIYKLEEIESLSELLIKILNNIPVILKEIGDPITFILNNSRGTIFHRLMDLIRLHSNISVGETHFYDKMLIYLESVLNQKNMQSVESFILIGMNFNFLLYLDENWVRNNLKCIFPHSNQNLFRLSVTGFLSGQGDIYIKSSELFLETRLYEKIIPLKLDSNTKSRVVWHICILYFENYIKLDQKSSLINILIKSRSPCYLREIIRYLLQIKKSLDSERRKKIKELWKKINGIIKDEEFEEKENIQSSLWKLIELFEIIDDEILQLVYDSIELSDKNSFNYFLVKILTEFLSTSTANVGKILDKILDKKIYISNENEGITEIVESLYNENHKDIANNICRKFLIGGYDFLKSTYDKYT
jgi:hypothetical protein